MHSAPRPLCSSADPQGVARHHVFLKTSHREVQLAEVGPRFEMRPYEIRQGTLEQSEADVEWVLRPFMKCVCRVSRSARGWPADLVRLVQLWTQEEPAVVAPYDGGQPMCPVLHAPSVILLHIIPDARLSCTQESASSGGLRSAASVPHALSYSPLKSDLCTSPWLLSSLHAGRSETMRHNGRVALK